MTPCRGCAIYYASRPPGSTYPATLNGHVYGCREYWLAWTVAVLRADPGTTCGLCARPRAIVVVAAPSVDRPSAVHVLECENGCDEGLPAGARDVLDIQ